MLYETSYSVSGALGTHIRMYFYTSYSVTCVWCTRCCMRSYTSYSAINMRRGNILIYLAGKPNVANVHCTLGFFYHIRLKLPRKHRVMRFLGNFRHFIICVFGNLAHSECSLWSLHFTDVLYLRLGPLIWIPSAAFIVILLGENFDCQRNWHWHPSKRAQRTLWSLNLAILATYGLHPLYIVPDWKYSAGVVARLYGVSWCENPGVAEMLPDKANGVHATLSSEGT